jgi:hypothetical protein
MPTATSYGNCQVCDTAFGFFSRRHPDCERRALLHNLDRNSDLSRNRGFYLSLPGWRAVEGAPAMYTLNGFGTKLYGQRDEHAGTMTATVTLYATGLFVPLFPIAVYRVVTLSDNNYSFLAKRSPEKADWLRVGRVWLWIFAVYGAWHLIFE